MANIDQLTTYQKAKLDGCVALALFPLGYYHEKDSGGGGAVCSSAFMHECAFQCVRSPLTLPVLPHRVTEPARKASLP